MRRRPSPPRLPGPRAHLAGTRALVERLLSLAGGHPQAGALLRLLDREEALPEAVPFEENSLKYDVWLTSAPGSRAFGVAVSDRYEGEAMLPALERLLSELPARYDWEAFLRLRDALWRPGTSLVCGVGFADPASPPRVKLYVQEERWAEGIARREELRRLAARICPGARIPEWLPRERPIGVVAMDLVPGGGVRLRAYLGGDSPEAAARGAPDEARALARIMAEACPHRPGWYYLTVRMDPDGGHRYAVNKIYSHVDLGFSYGGALLELGWRDVGRLFRAAGREEALGALRAELSTVPGVRVVPTATALEDGGRSADVYCAGWWIGDEPAGGAGRGGRV